MLSKNDTILSEMQLMRQLESLLQHLLQTLLHCIVVIHIVKIKIKTKRLQLTMNYSRSL